MSNMLEQAIIDAAALREAALKNAEQSLIEKYAPQIKEAVESMLDSDIIKESRKVKYEGRIAQITTEADVNGMVGISEGGKTYLVNESEVQELSEDELLQEEDMDLGSTGGPTASIEAPFGGNPMAQNDQKVNFSIGVDDADDVWHINLDDLEDKLDPQMPEEDKVDIDTMADEEIGLGELDGDEEGLLGGEDQLQELMDLLSSYDGDLLEEEAVADMGAAKQGWITTDIGHQEYEQNMQLGAEALMDEDEDDTPSEEEDEALKQTQAVENLYETIDLLKTQNAELESVVYKLSDKLEETLTSNAKFLYQNRTLCDASLNERQKSKIVEAIAKAESPKEAKHLHETLRTTVGSDQKKRPQSLSETVNRRSNLSGILNSRRQNLNESKTADPFLKKMQKLAGIK
jgi:hypothetical protein